MSDAKWYVIHTYSGYENKVKDTLLTIVENRNLQDLIFDVKIPLETVTEIDKDGKQKQVERKVFPGYVLVKMIVTDDSWFIVRNIRGVTGFVGASSTAPVPLSDKEVAALGVESTGIKVGYKIGDTVEIVDGPLKPYVGIVDSIDPENNSIRVIISMFGRETPVDLDLSQIRIFDK
jgi:transcriptional antiterminator NusG